MTGLSPDVASFQAASAFLGAGHTTEESEQTVATPERRRIIKTLIRLGSLSLLGALVPLIGSFAGGDGNLITLVYILVGAATIVVFARSRWLNRLVTPLIRRALSETTGLEIRDYSQLLGLYEEYRVSEIDAGAGDWITDGPLSELDLAAEGVLVLGIERSDGSYLGAPGPDAEIQPGDTLVVYGRQHRLEELAGRRTGDSQAREDAVDDHEEHLEGRDQRGRTRKAGPRSRRLQSGSQCRTDRRTPETTGPPTAAMLVTTSRSRR